MSAVLLLRKYASTQYEHTKNPARRRGSNKNNSHKYSPILERRVLISCAILWSTSAMSENHGLEMFQNRARVRIPKLLVNLSEKVHPRFRKTL